MNTKMYKDKYDIKDDEFRILGSRYQSEENTLRNHTDKRKWILVGCIGLVGLLLLVTLIFSLIKTSTNTDETSNTISPLSEKQFQKVTDEYHPLPLGSNSDTTKAYTEHLRDTINDIPIDILIPHNAKPRLCFGPLNLNDPGIVLMASAADIRADNGYPVGAYVMEGNPVCGGSAKLGYCAIINEKLTLGMAENSPLFEESTKTNGYFFRQFPLVHNGMQIENEARGKSIRKALCTRGEEIFIAMTASNESYHDFAQALVDLKVDNAIALVGSIAFAGYRNQDGDLNIIYSHMFRTKYENFIIWE